MANSDAADDAAVPPAGAGDRAARAAAPYQVVARRFRPKAFDEVVGQEAIQSSLRAALHSKRIPHAFLFAGSRGVGKTTTARILARCLNCEQGPTDQPCGTCKLCLSIQDGSNPDVIEIDAASNNGVDDIRALRDRIAFAPMLSRYKVYVLDEAHMMSGSAFNAFLKTLEEPPAGVVFVLATTELHKVPETIRSRCQVLHFRRISDEDIAKRLQMIVAAEQVDIDPAVLAEIAGSCRGGMRDAETGLERVLQVARETAGTFGIEQYREIVQRIGIDRAVEVATALVAGDAGAGLHFARELQESGGDEREALGDLVEVLRLALLLQVDGPDSGLVTHVGRVREMLQSLAKSTDRARLAAMVQAGLIGRERQRHVDDRGIVLELTMIRMAEAGALPDLGQLVAAARDGRLVTGVVQGPAGGRTGGAGAHEGASAPAGSTAPATPMTGSGVRARVLALAADQKLLLATLEQCQFLGPDGRDVVTVRLQSERRMHRDRMASPGLQQQVTGFVTQACGKPVQVQFEVAEARPEAPPPEARPPGKVASKVLEKFGGRVVAVDPDDVRPKAAPADAEPAEEIAAEVEPPPPEGLGAD